MELRHLRYFVAVAEELSFVRAARRLRIAQPALSKQIRDLEYEVGATLFHRLPRGVRLTAAGEAFLPEARETLRGALRARDRARDAAQGEAASLRIAHGELYGYAVAIEKLLAAFREVHPDVRLQVVSQSDADTESSLRSRTVDVGCVFVTQWPVDGFEAHRLLDCAATGVLLPARHSLAAGQVVHLAELQGMQWLGSTPDRWPGVNRTVEAALRSRGLVALHDPERPGASPFVNVVAEDKWALASEVVAAPYRNGSTAVVYRPFTDPPIPAWLALAWGAEAPPLVHHLVSVARNIGLSVGEGQDVGGSAKVPANHRRAIND
jgi:DNA-binding transcriptional LysR family regulator